MDVLVTGGTGFVGTAVCRDLDDRGHDVTAFSRTPGDADLPESVDLAAGDVTDRDSVEDALAGQDAVVHLVSLSPLYRPSGGEAAYERVNVEGTRNVVEAAEAADVDRIVHVGALGSDPDATTAFLRTKGEAERIVRESALDWTILRPSVVFGEGGEFVSFTRSLTPPLLAPLPGGGKTRFHPIWVEDFADLVGESLADEAHVGQSYDVGGPEVLSLADVARLAARAQGSSLTVVPVPMPLAGLGLTLAGHVPFSPFGADQYRSLKRDNVATDDAVTTAFGRSPDDLRTLSDYLGVE